MTILGGQSFGVFFIWGGYGGIDDNLKIGEAMGLCRFLFCFAWRLIGDGVLLPYLEGWR